MNEKKWSVQICGLFYFQNEYGEWDATGEDEEYTIVGRSDLNAREEAIEAYRVKYQRPDIEIVLEDIQVHEKKGGF
jgi:hypothetical protein